MRPVRHRLDGDIEPEVFVIGDMAFLEYVPRQGAQQSPYAMVAPVAIQMGERASKNILARMRRQPSKPFKYFDKGNMATIGYRSAVADAFHVRVTGLIAYLMWGFVHVWYLIGWGNRIGTIYQWLRALVFTKNRNHRIITFGEAQHELDESRMASGRLPAILPARPDDAPLAPPVPAGRPKARRTSA